MFCKNFWKISQVFQKNVHWVEVYEFPIWGNLARISNSRENSAELQFFSSKSDKILLWNHHDEPYSDDGLLLESTNWCAAEFVPRNVGSPSTSTPACYCIQTHVAQRISRTSPCPDPIPATGASDWRCHGKIPLDSYSDVSFDFPALPAPVSTAVPFWLQPSANGYALQCGSQPDSWI